jgi:hypothetical protein
MRWSMSLPGAGQAAPRVASFITFAPKRCATLGLVTSGCVAPWRSAGVEPWPSSARHSEAAAVGRHITQTGPQEPGCVMMAQRGVRRRRHTCRVAPEGHPGSQSISAQRVRGSWHSSEQRSEGSPPVRERRRPSHNAPADPSRALVPWRHRSGERSQHIRKNRTHTT